MQVAVLKNLNFEEAVLIGGTALVMGNGNPRFSEDVDLAGVERPEVFYPDMLSRRKVMAMARRFPVYVQKTVKKWFV